MVKNLRFNTQLSRTRVNVHCTQNASVYQTSWSAVIYNSRTTRMGEIKCLYCCCVRISLTKCFFTVIRQIVFYSSAFIRHCLWIELFLHPMSIHKSRHLLEQTMRIHGFSVRHRQAVLDANLLAISRRSEGKVSCKKMGKTDENSNRLEKDAQNKCYCYYRRNNH